MGVYLLSRFASERVKVLLGGEGADEAFAGYGYFASSHRLYPMKGRVARVRDVRQLLNADHGPLRFRGGLIRRNPFSDRVNQQIYYSLHTYLQTIENRLDKMSMGAGVEFRVPYLDHHLVEASLRLPGDMKLKGNITKYILKKLAERYLPKEQIYRPKVGFSTPLNSWIRTDAFRKYVSILKEERTLKRPYYREWGILALLSNFENRPDTFLYSYAGLIWNLLNLEMWIRTFIEEKQSLES
jgi:asparagine synthetase B (glutamine-hydrolysing)